MPGMTLRSVEPGDGEFFYRVYASTRQEELAQTGWSETRRESFLRQQLEAQSGYYREYYQEASFDVILAYGRPIGRLYVARWPREIRIVDIVLLPAHRDAPVTRPHLRVRSVRETLEHPRRTVQLRTAPLRTARLPRGRRQRRLPAHGASTRNEIATRRYIG
jgi:crotonobetainyl-CoA:carnitine CoA-transferase CaiB-like acyl-CoA transferase